MEMIQTEKNLTESTNVLLLRHIVQVVETPKGIVRHEQNWIGCLLERYDPNNILLPLVRSVTNPKLPWTTYKTIAFHYCDFIPEIDQLLSSNFLLFLIRDGQHGEMNLSAD